MTVPSYYRIGRQSDYQTTIVPHSFSSTVRRFSTLWPIYGSVVKSFSCMSAERNSL